jgi:hypothetical protein
MSSLPRSQISSHQIFPTSKSSKKLGKKAKEYSSKSSKIKNLQLKKNNSQEDLITKKNSFHKSEKNLQKPEEIQSSQASSYRPSHRKSSSFNQDSQNSAINDLKTAKTPAKPSSPKAKKGVKKSLISCMSTKLHSKRASLEIPLNKTTDYLKSFENSSKQEKKTLKTKNLGNKLKVLEKQVKNQDFSQKFKEAFFEKSVNCFNKDSKPLKSILSKGKFSKTKSLKFSKSFRTDDLHPIEESLKSSALETENDEWVNFLDSKFQGSNSYYVEEFRQKLIKERVTSFDLNEEHLTNQLSKDLCTDLNLSSSESLSMNYPLKITEKTYKKPAKVPSLPLNLLNFEAEFQRDSDSVLSSDLHEILSSEEGCKSSENLFQSTKDPSLESFRVKSVPFNSFCPERPENLKNKP